MKARRSIVNYWKLYRMSVAQLVLLSAALHLIAWKSWLLQAITIHIEGQLNWPERRKIVFHIFTYSFIVWISVKNEIFTGGVTD